MSGLADLMVGDALASSRHAERAFVRSAKAIERLPRLVAARRANRMESALDNLRLAVVLRGVAQDYAGEDRRARLGDLEEESVIRARWREAELRIRLAAERGALRPKALKRAVDLAIGIEVQGDVGGGS